MTFGGSSEKGVSLGTPGIAYTPKRARAGFLVRWVDGLLDRFDAG
jgi:hypothetical protein